MFILYLDESGDPYGWDRQDHFVLAGIAVHEQHLYDFSRRLDSLQGQYFPGISIPIAFHATDIQSGKGRYRDLERKTREALLDDICSVVCEARFPQLVVFATVMHVSAVTSPDQVLHDTFQDICQRFNTLLVRGHNRGFHDKGLLIIDKAHQDRYRQLISDFQRDGTEYGYLGNILDIPYFAGRHDTRMLQLADFCAHAVFRRYRSSEEAST